MDECPRARRWFGPDCRFEPRYDEVANATPVTPEMVKALGDNLVYSEDVAGSIADLSRGQQRYVCDICIRCGRVVERSTHPNGDRT